MQANVKLAGAMGTATKTMVNMNKIMKPEEVAKNMRDFEIASAKLDMTDEVSKYGFYTKAYCTRLLLDSLVG